ncbi:MAG: hypothetical protein IPL33_14765 [Sphingobacteriales bacterium]|nr:hypothetical protein [Sphingobacteriales bacterium]
MKKIILIISFFIIAHYSPLMAQVSLHSTFGQSVTGRSYRIGANYFLNEHLELGGGVKIIKWKRVTDDQGYLFTNRFRPANLREHFGAYLNFAYYPFRRGAKMESLKMSPFIFYDFSLTHSTLLAHAYTQVTIIDTITHAIFYTPMAFVTYEFNPTTAIEHHIGLGFDVCVYKGWQFTQKIGAGIATFYNIDPSIIMTGDDDWQFAWLYQIGLKYSFASPKPKKKVPAP